MKRLNSSLILTAFITGACASVLPMMPFEKRMYHFCSDEEVSNPVGKLCYSRCVDYSFFKKKCKEWELKVENINDPKIFYQFRAAGFKVKRLP